MTISSILPNNKESYLDDNLSQRMGFKQSECGINLRNRKALLVESGLSLSASASAAAWVSVPP